MNYYEKYIKYKNKYTAMKSKLFKGYFEQSSTSFKRSFETSIERDSKESLTSNKNEFLNLQKQIGGGTTIINFTKYEHISTSEVIAHGQLQEHMTQHGLGSGIYGFLNEINAGSYMYNEYKTPIEINNCLKLEEQWYQDGEIISELTRFTNLSMKLNEICFKLYELIITEKEQFNFDDYSPTIISLFEHLVVGIKGLSILTSERIIYSIKTFLTDYIMLMNTNPLEEDYIVMPINYLLYGLYDGICNSIDDSGKTGSVSYIYTNPRSYKRSFAGEKIKSLRGNRIFDGIKYKDPKIKGTLRPRIQAPTIVF